jgi:hypothetical protein
LFLRLVVLRTRMLQGTRNRPVVYEISLFSPNEHRFILVRPVYATCCLQTSVFLPYAGQNVVERSRGAFLTRGKSDGSADGNVPIA